MRNYSKLLSLVVFTTLGTMLWSCKDDETTTPQSTLTCTLKSATIGKGTNATIFNFGYNTQNELISISDGDINGNLIYQNNKVILNIPEIEIADTLLLQGGKWVSSFGSNQYEDNDSSVIFTKTTIIPIYSGTLITKLKMLSVEQKRVNGILQFTDRDSSFTSFTYDIEGNVVKIDQPEGDSFELTYADSTLNTKVNNYFNAAYFSELFDEALILPFLTGNLKLCNRPPSSIYRSERPAEKSLFKGIKADANKNLTEISMYDGISTEPYDTYKFTYDCK